MLTQTQEASPQLGSKTPLPSGVRQIVLALSSIALVRVMQFPPSNPVRPLPVNAAAWTRLANATRESHYLAWGPDLLVNVGSSKLVEAMPLLDFTERGGQKFLPLNVIVFFLGRLGWVEDRSLAIDLTAGLSPATLSKFEAWAVADKRLDWSPTSETDFLQRVLALAAELATATLPEELKVDQDSFVPFEGHDDSAGGPDWTDSWQSRMTAFSLTQFSMLGPYADVSLLFGPMLREDVRTDPDGRPMLVAETLASWATAGSLASFATAHRRLPLLVSEALKDHVLPVQLSASITAFPAMLRDLDARFAWSDATKSASVLRYRFPCALYSLPALNGLLAGEAEATKFDTACNLLATQLPKVTAPSLAAFTQLDRHLAAVGYDLSGDTAAERMDAMAARDERDDDLRAAAPYGGTGSGGGGAGKTALDSEPKPRMHIKTTVKLLQVWLNSPEVAGPLVFSTAPVAAAFGVAAVAGVPDEARSGVGALITYYHDLGDSFEVLRVALARRSVPLTQAVVFDVSTSHPIFDAISSARGDLTAYVSSKLASLDDGTLEMDSDELWRASADFVVKLIEGKWSKINWHDDVLRAIEIERCKSAASASVKDVDQQWFCSRAALVVTYADRALSILGFNRNDEFHSAVSSVLRVTDTTPASSAAKAQLKEHAVRQIAELMNAASTRYRAFIGASSCVPFPAFTNVADKAAAMQTEAKATRHLVTSIGRCMPIMLHGAAAADDDDDDDDDGSGGGKPSKRAKKKAARALADAQQANRDAKKLKANGGGGGGGGGGRRRRQAAAAARPGDLAGRVRARRRLRHVPLAEGPGPERQAANAKTFDVAGIKKELTRRRRQGRQRKQALRPVPVHVRIVDDHHRRRQAAGARPPLLPQPAATSTTTRSQPARTSSCPGSTAPC